MSKHSVIARPSLVAAAAGALLLSGGLFAQGPNPDSANPDPADDAPVVIAAPSAWATLRSDSVAVSVQADTSRLPKGSVDFKVSKRSGGRSSALFSKSVKMDGIGAEVFLGQLRDAAIGGADYLSVEWSVPGTDFKGVIEPVGIAGLKGEVSAADNKWVPSPAPLSAARLKDGAQAAEAAAALAGSQGAFEAGGVKFAAGWNAEGLYILFTPEQGVTGAEFAFDLKCGKSAFRAWADRFIVYDAAADTVYGRHYGKRSVGKDGMNYAEMAWGNARTLGMSKEGPARLVSARWHELGIQAFDGRNMGFAVFVKGKAKQPAAYPAAANGSVPGTWGDLKLEK